MYDTCATYSDDVGRDEVDRSHYSFLVVEANVQSVDDSPRESDLGVRNQLSGPNIQLNLPDLAATRALAVRLAGVLRAGDLVLLNGALGAGKTIFTQSLGAALGVQGRVSSPTFIIARVHPGGVQPHGERGPSLVHVDAYRLGGLDELDALDLDDTLADAITVVEWGRGKVESLAEDRLEIDLEREPGTQVDGDAPPDDVSDEPRQVTIRGFGPRWAEVDLAAAIAVSDA